MEEKLNELEKRIESLEGMINEFYSNQFSTFVDLSQLINQVINVMVERKITTNEEIIQKTEKIYEEIKQFATSDAEYENEEKTIIN